MASTSELQKLCDEIIKSIKEYSTEDIVDLEEAKAQIVELLKTHQAVKLVDYEFGLSHSLKKDHRLIVKEEESDKSKVREYGKNKEYWYCSNSSMTTNKCFSPKLKFIYGILFTPKNHKCKPRDYSVVLKIQDLLRQGKTLEAAKWLRRRNHTNKNDSKSINSTFNESNSTTLDTTDMKNESIAAESILTDSRRYSNSSRNANPFLPTISSANINDNLTSLTPPPSLPDVTPRRSATVSLVKRELNPGDDDLIILVEPVSTVKTEPDENNVDDNCIILQEPVAKRAKVEPRSDTEIYSFCRPSDAILKKKCEKLKIEYNHEAYVLWGKIIFNEIRPTSNNLKTHEFKSPNVYACLSMFFTGKSDSCYLIQHLINTAFRNELVASGTMENKDIEQICTCGIVSNEHLQFISKFLSCRIGIYENETLKKYGNWDTANNALTLILSFVYGLYSVVTDI